QKVVHNDVHVDLIFLLGDLHCYSRPNRKLKRRHQPVAVPAPSGWRTNDPTHQLQAPEGNVIYLNVCLDVVAVELINLLEFVAQMVEKCPIAKLLRNSERPADEPRFSLLRIGCSGLDDQERGMYLSMVVFGVPAIRGPGSEYCHTSPMRHAIALRH